jgi:hypothetical protein
VIADGLKHLVDAANVTVEQDDEHQWTVTLTDELVVLSQAELDGLVDVLKRHAGGQWSYVVTLHQGELSVTLTQV